MSPPLIPYAYIALLSTITCNPAPSKLAKITMSVTFELDWTIITAIPLVGPDLDYCKRIGFTDNSGYCPVRKECKKDQSQQQCKEETNACLSILTGERPNWPKWDVTIDVNPNSWKISPDNPFQVLVVPGTKGTFVICAKNNICGISHLR